MSVSAAVQLKIRHVQKTKGWEEVVIKTENVGLLTALVSVPSTPFFTEKKRHLYKHYVIQKYHYNISAMA